MATTSQLPFIVIDQNRLRDANVVASAIEQCREYGLEILIPDVAGFEFSKAIERPEDALRTWRCSLQHLASFPELVVAGRKLPELWKEELGTGTPVRKVVDDRATAPLRDLLRGIGASDSTLRSFVTERVARMIPLSGNSAECIRGILQRNGGNSAVLAGCRRARCRRSEESYQ
jgi:hypothetical protein